MSDVWHYAEGDAVRGPMSLAELAAKIAHAPQPGSVLVWRPGFKAWQRAETVDDVVAALRQQPSLTSERPTALRQTESAPSGQAAGNAQDTDGTPTPGSNPEPSGIRGWLILMAIGQILGPLRFFVTGAQYYGSLDGDLFRQFPATFIGEAAMNAALGVLYVYTASLFFRTSKRFPRFFVYEVIATALTLPLNALWVAVTISMVSEQSVAAGLQTALEPREIAQTIIGAIVGGIWIGYLFKSKRVANTFVN